MVESVLLLALNFCTYSWDDMTPNAFEAIQWLLVFSAQPLLDCYSK